MSRSLIVRSSMAVRSRMTVRYCLTIWKGGPLSRLLELGLLGDS